MDLIVPGQVGQKVRPLVLHKRYVPLSCSDAEGFLKAFPAHGEGGPLAVDEVPGSPILDSIVPGQVGQGTVHAAKPRTKCMSEVEPLLYNYFVALTRINRPLVPFAF